MDLHDGSFDSGGHPIDDGDGMSEHADPTAHSMIATGYEGPGTDDSLTSPLDDHLDDAAHLDAPEDSDSAGDQDAMTGASGDGDHDIDITINGQEFDGQATLDSDGDGHDDTALVTLNEQGNQAAITDLDGDGHADEATLFDPDGNTIDHQHVDASGTWIDDGRPGIGAGGHDEGPSVIGAATVEPDPSASDPAAGMEQSTDGQAGDEHAGDPIRMNLHGQEYQTTDTRDTDHDGTADTGVLPTSDGGQLVVTDTDGDGTADHAEVFDPSGHDQGGIFVTSDGQSTPDGDNGHESQQPPAEAARSSWVVDPATGDWVTG